MTKPKQEQEISLADDIILNQIYVIREQKVMLDIDLAELYHVETKVLKQAVKRNIDRFPDDFMFEMSKQELTNWRSQFVTSNKDKQGLRCTPFCFTEQAVAMLSSILNSKQAIKVNIKIMRIFTKMRQMLSDNTSPQLIIAEIKVVIQNIMKKQDDQNKSIDLLFGYIEKLQEKWNNLNLLTEKGLDLRIGGNENSQLFSMFHKACRTS